MGGNDGRANPGIKAERRCKDCPYFSEELAEDYPEFEYFCNRSQMESDAIALLKSLEPRLLTMEEITGDGECWFEGINGACGYADCYLCTGSKEVELHRISRKPEYVLWDDFMKKWRCWSYRPTDKQREAVKWDG